MDFTRSQFTSPVHEAIWNAERLVFPLEKSLSKIENETTKAACTDLYNCVLDGYEDISANPDVYGINLIDVELLLQGKQWGKAMILADLKEDKDKLKQFNKIGSHIGFTRSFLERLKNDNYITLYDKSAAISIDGYKKFFKQHYRSVYGFNEEKFLELIKRLSFEITLIGDRYELVNTKYPGIFKALRMMRDVARKEKSSYKNPIIKGYDFLDFRILSDNYECSLEDALYSLDEENKKEIIRLDEFLTSLGTRRKCRLNSVEWIYKSKRIVIYDGTKRHLDASYGGNAKDLIVVHFQETWRHGWGAPEYNPEHREMFEQIVNSLPNAYDIKRFCLVNLIKCSMCGCRQHGAPPYGHPKYLFGKTLYTCGGSARFGATHLQNGNFDIIVDLIKINIQLMVTPLPLPHDLKLPLKRDEATLWDPSDKLLKAANEMVVEYDGTLTGAYSFVRVTHHSWIWTGYSSNDETGKEVIAEEPGKLIFDLRKTKGARLGFWCDNDDIAKVKRVYLR